MAKADIQEIIEDIADDYVRLLKQASTIEQDDLKGDAFIEELEKIEERIQGLNKQERSQAFQELIQNITASYQFAEFPLLKLANRQAIINFFQIALAGIPLQDLTKSTLANVWESLGRIHIYELQSAKYNPEQKIANIDLVVEELFKIINKKYKEEARMDILPQQADWWLWRQLILTRLLLAQNLNLSKAFTTNIFNELAILFASQPISLDPTPLEEFFLNNRHEKSRLILENQELFARALLPIIETYLHQSVEMIKKNMRPKKILLTLPSIILFDLLHKDQQLSLQTLAKIDKQIKPLAEQIISLPNINQEHENLKALTYIFSENKHIGTSPIKARIKEAQNREQMPEPLIKAASAQIQEEEEDDDEKTFIPQIKSLQPQHQTYNKEITTLLSDNEVNKLITKELQNLEDESFEQEAIAQRALKIATEIINTPERDEKTRRRAFILLAEATYALANTALLDNQTAATILEIVNKAQGEELARPSSAKRLIAAIKEATK